MTSLKRLAFVLLAATTVSALQAETRCPGNAERLPLKTVDRYLMIVAVSVNQSGPYDFLLDTGTQYTIIDPSLAAKLSLSTSGSAAVADVGSPEAASIAQVGEVKVGSHSVANLRVIVYNLGLKSPDLAIRGILGQDFLEHFDYLIDYAHSMLCLDDTHTMRTEVKGSHIPLLPPPPAAREGGAVYNQLIVNARFFNGMRPIRLKLDSGTNAAFLYQPSEYLEIGSYQGVSLHGAGVNGEQRQFVALPPQDLRVGRVELSKIQFAALRGGKKDTTPKAFDGLLPTGLFRRILVCHSDNFIVLEPR